MKRILCLSLFAALALTGHAAIAADACAKLTVTGHPQYPVIMYKDGDRIAGLGPMLVEAPLTRRQSYHDPCVSNGFVILPQACQQVHRVEPSVRW